MRAKCRSHRHPASPPTYVRCPEAALQVFELLTEGVDWKQLMVLVLTAERRGRIAAVFDELGGADAANDAMDHMLLESSLVEGRYVVLGSYRPDRGTEPSASDLELYFDLSDAFESQGLTLLDWFLLDADRWCSVGAVLDQPWPWS